MNPIKILATLLLVFLAGCAMWERIDKAGAEAPDKSYSVELPVGWVRYMQQPDGIALTRDGFDLNRIHIQRRDLAKAFPLLKKAAQPDLLPSELAELQIAEIKTAAKETVIEVKANSPAPIGGQAGYRLHLQYRNDRGLMFDRVIYGLVTPRGYFTLSFAAPALHYSARDLPVFEKVVGSFRLEGG